MTDRYFAACCYGTDEQHASWTSCPAQGMETAKPPKREAGSARKGDSPVPSGMRPEDGQ